MSRLVPAYVEKPAWRLYDLIENDADWDEIQDAKEDLRAALVRGEALVHAPDYVLMQELKAAP